MYGIEKYQEDARKAGILDRLKAEKFEEIRDAARELRTAEAARKVACEAYADALFKDQFAPDVPVLLAELKAAEQEKADCRFVLNRLIDRAAEGDL